MRVVAGTFRSRPLLAPRGLATRPTSDRLRETLFNVLGSRVEGARFADLFAGSGAVGIEALSRGARHVFLFENHPAASAVIRRNLQSLGIQDNYTLVSRPLAAALRAPQAHDRPWDIAFLDPPYEDAAAYEATLVALSRPGRMAQEGIVIAEHRKTQGGTPSKGSGLAECYGSLRRYRVLEQGAAALSFYRFEASPPSDPSPAHP